MKAIALISGGLDSILAARVVKEQGIDIIPLNFKIPFCHINKKFPAAASLASLTRNSLGLELITIDISADFLKLLIAPAHGFGANMNPCIDCKILMLQKTKELLQGYDAAFVVTGEVVGQRPMSQSKQMLNCITRKAGLSGLVLRPLSAKLIPETVPEAKGWIKRENLLNFGGRGRRPQIELANKFAIKDYPQPAGGCLLTDPEFTKRMQDLIAHKELTLDNINLLKIGRHFRMSGVAKLIVGRSEEEDNYLISLAMQGDYVFMPTEEMAGPTSLGRGLFDEHLIRLCCAITASYCDSKGKNQTDIIYYRVSEDKTEFSKLERASLKVQGISGDELATLRV